MKTINALIFIVLFSLFTPLFGQTDKGSALIGGALTANGTFQKREETSFELILAGNYAPFVRNNIAIGGILGYVYSTQILQIRRFPEQREHLHFITIGPFFRFYFGKNQLVKPFFGFWGMAGIALRNGREKFHFYTTNVEGGPGVAVFLNENVAIELGLVYTGNWIGYQYEHNFGLRTGFQVHLTKKQPNN